MRSFSFLIMIIATISVVAKDKPNILWLTSEDNNVNWIGCYGNPHAKTPNIDKLAKEGFQYMNCYANAPVCAPSRSTWITGIHALSMGTHPMRSRYEIPHNIIKYYPDLLKENGYYVSNDKKTDYNIGGRIDKSPWDSMKINWQKLKQKQPFFQVYNSKYSHESKAFGDVTKTTHDPRNTKLAKYHPDVLEMRQNYAHYHDAVSKMDKDIGKALADLEKSGLSENTIVIYNSDHGGVLPRSKRFLYNSGTHSPLIIRIPEKFKHLWPAEKSGMKVDRLVSFVDMTKTWLDITGSKKPSYLSGKVFLGPNAEAERQYHVSFRGRMDERCDNVRAIRNKKYLYIRNYMPYAPTGQHLNFLWRMTATQVWEREHKAGRTDSVTGRFFDTKPMEELYDTSKDPDNVNNLINNPEMKPIIAEMRTTLNDWQVQHFDSALLPESEVVKKAADNDTTIYEMVRNPALYDVKALQEAANTALENEPSSLPKLYGYLKDSDAGIRYWGIVGCFNLIDKTEIDLTLVKAHLTDDSHEVRALAAWVLYKKGHKDVAIKTWNDLLANSSYASLKVTNIIDWIGEGVEPYKDSIIKCNFSHGGYVDRMKEYFGLTAPKTKKK
ncbi:MAG: sulfatase [Lentisphaeraceae bacterium]|nr:sulfatase [Lentisphaeraceae bacterium]